VIVLNRWQNPGDNAAVQKYTSRLGGDAGLAAANLSNSDGIFSDASFIRLKNISLSYSLSGRLLKKLSLSDLTFYLRAQNLATITGYKGSDPETQDFYVLPPLKTIVAGIKLKF
jgi:hypothetical protein